MGSRLLIQYRSEGRNLRDTHHIEPGRSILFDSSGAPRTPGMQKFWCVLTGLLRHG